ncbi:low temperature requirement protein A [Micromonospora soli]|uniref:low temperature requirement protein A n=1 Tax=Micromonospora sp. NBRC 110009 TaxID=3061627 RepID=UPI0026734F69|nr:low temperature requirement protein A [Micromonospora sp. NBRC 110009]WKT98443.1 low temperature requirement protein A [Micromonospora sp. NBRC 110009]
MARRDVTHLVNKGEATHRATFLELFFDLVFVFAFNRITARAVGEFATDPGKRGVILSDVGKTVVLLLALWSIWHVTAWTTSRYDPRNETIQLVVIVRLIAAMVMGVAITGAFSDRGLAFAAAYVTAQVLHPLVLAIMLRGSERKNLKLRMLITFSITGILWIVGALVPPGWGRGVLWALALSIEFGSARLGWPVPGLGRSPTWKWDLSGEHLADRYQSFFLIALGETVLVAGLTYSGERVSAGRTIAFAAALATTVLFWRIYFYRAGQILPEAVSKAKQPAIFGRSTADSHMIMLAGIVATSIGYELTIDHPYGEVPPPWLAVVLGGPALFMIGRSRLEHEVFDRVSPARIVVLVVLVALFPVLMPTRPLVGLVAATLVLAGAAIADWRRARGAPPEPAKPGK